MDLFLEGEATTSLDAHARADFLIRWANVLSDHQRAKAFDLVVPDIRSLLWCELPAPQQDVVSYTTPAPVPPNLIGDTYRRGDVLLLAHMRPSIGAETAILILEKHL